MDKRIRTFMNFKAKPEDITKIDKTKKSKTEPDLNLTVREILTRFTSGNLPDIQHKKLSEESVTFDDYQNFMDPDYDLADMTQDKIRLLEIKHDVDKAIKIKADRRAAKQKQEKVEYDSYLEWKKEQENKAPEKTTETQ